MKRVVLALSAALLFLAGAAWAGDVYVRGYFRSDGSYVKPHYRSAPDGNVFNNWSTKGNVNPYSGKAGTKDPYKLGNGGSSYGYGNSLFAPSTTFGGGSRSGTSLLGD